MDKKPDIKIFVSHRIDLDSETIDNPLYVNVRCGAVFDKRKNVTMLGDDTGDNISEKRKSLCELTVMYWAWKNIKADYYGFCHYRRYFSFSSTKYQEDEYALLQEDYITDEVVKKYDITNYSSICNLIDKYDCIVTTPFDVKNVGVKNLREQYIAQTYLHSKDFDLLVDIIKNIYPEYYDSAIQYLYGDKLISCSMFIMKKELFFSYMKWLFKIIDELEQRIDMTEYTEEGFRTISHLAERLLGVFVTKIKQNINIGYVQRILFRDTNRAHTLFPASKDVIPVVFASSDYYIPYLYITIVSMCENLNIEDKYEIIILNTKLSKHNKQRLLILENTFPNIIIKFFNISRLLHGYTFIANNHVSVETFYRLFIPVIFSNYDKVVYLDSDLIIKNDVKELFEISSNDKIITATRDFDYESQYRRLLEVKKYTKNVLGLDDVSGYFQAGVIVFNVKKYNKKYKYNEMLKFATSREFMYVDQDVMNSMLQGEVQFVSNEWNVMTDCAGSRSENIKKYASVGSCEAYFKSRENPKIIHFAGWAKPWERPEDDFAYEFWRIARRTPYYEVILGRMSNNLAWSVLNFHKYKDSFIFNKICKILLPKNQNDRMKLKCKVNKFISILAPLGTKRRRILKEKYNKLRGR